MVKFDKDGYSLESGMVTIYHFDDDGNYLDKEEHYISKGGSEPANSCRIKPPRAKRGKKPVWDRENAKWSLKPPIKHTPTLEERNIELSNIYNKKLNNGIYYKPECSDKEYLFGTDMTSFNKLSHEFTLAKNGLYDDNTSYLTKDGIFVKMNARDIENLTSLVSSYRASVSNHAHTLQDALKDNINADLNKGWD